LSNKVAHTFEDAGFKPGDTVALLLDNRPEYVAIWLGLAKAGLIIALINYNLKGSSLSHSINIVGSKAVIFGASFTQGITVTALTVSALNCHLITAVEEIRDQLNPMFPLYVFDSDQNGIPVWSKSLDVALQKASTEKLAGEQRANSTDKLLYIYTSGTTGLPKAAVIRHTR
jgi:solute carrier family 27 (fatty acid transporter), member 1/4